MPIQSVLFDKKKYTTTSARKWLIRHNLKPIKRVDKTKNLLRYRLEDPKKFKSFRTITLSANIKAVVGYQ